MKHSLLIAEFLSTPWALQRERLAAYASIVARWAEGAQAMEDDGEWRETKSAWQMRREQAARLGGGGTAVLPLYGTIVQRAGVMTEWCGGTSTQQFTAAFREAMADESVSSILIDVDSPGGSVYGVQELADEILQARGKKQIVAFANSLAASAAYWVAAAADELYVTPGGEVGSIGVWMAHEDWSMALEAMGVKTTLISAGKYKTEGNPYQPLDQEALAFMQSRVNDYYGAFVRGIAKARDIPVGQVRDGMGQGRVLGASDAAKEQMVNGVATFDEVLKKMRRAQKTVAGASRLQRAQSELRIINEAG